MKLSMKTVYRRVSISERDLTLEEAWLIKNDAGGDTLELPLEAHEEFGLNVAQTLKAGSSFSVSVRRARNHV